MLFYLLSPLTKINPTVKPFWQYFCTVAFNADFYKAKFGISLELMIFGNLGLMVKRMSSRNNNLFFLFILTHFETK